MMKIYNFVCIYIFGQWKATVVNVGPNFTTKCHIIRKWGFLVFGSLQIFGSKRKRGGETFGFWLSGFFVFGFMVLEGNFFCTELGIFFLVRPGSILFWSEVGTFLVGLGFLGFWFLVLCKVSGQREFSRQSVQQRRGRDVFCGTKLYIFWLVKSNFSE
jgi:hypothetical protein